MASGHILLPLQKSNPSHDIFMLLEMGKEVSQLTALVFVRVLLQLD